MHDADSELARVLGMIDSNRLPFELDFTRIGLMHAREYFHERRFSRSVLTDQRGHLPRMQTQIRIRERTRAPKGLLDVREGEERHVLSDEVTG